MIANPALTRSWVTDFTVLKINSMLALPVEVSVAQKTTAITISLIAEYILDSLRLRFHASKIMCHLFWLFFPSQLVALGYEGLFNQYGASSTIYSGLLLGQKGSNICFVCSGVVHAV